MPVQVRYVEFIPHEQGVIIRDPLGLVEPLLVPPETAILIFTIATSESREEVKEKFAQQTGLLIKDEDIDRLIQQLDEFYLLYNERFLSRLEEIERELQRQSFKYLDVFSDEDYLDFQSEVRKRMESVDTAGGGDSIAGLLVPHIDYNVAMDTYISAYSLIARSSRDVIFILGVPHSMARLPMSILNKPYHVYSTVVHNEEEIIASIRSALDFDPTGDILAFRNEHSIEFPVAFLSTIKSSPFRIVPIIVSESDRQRLQEFADVIMRAVEGQEERVLFISSVDFSHVGKKFGDAEPFDTSEVDRTYLDYLLNLQNNEAYEYLEELQNYTRIDGQYTNYLFVELMKRMGASGSLMDYRKFEEKETDSIVTYASARFDVD